MHFPFYPKHEYGCPHVNHCPHLGSASLGSVVHAANFNEDQIDLFWRQIDGLRAENTAKSGKIEELTARVEQLERELKAERQKQFKSTKEASSEQVSPDAVPRQAQRNAVPPKAIRAGIASGPLSSIGWLSSPHHANARTATDRSRPGPIARSTIISRKTGSTASGW